MKTITDTVMPVAEPYKIGTMLRVDSNDDVAIKFLSKQLFYKVVEVRVNKVDGDVNYLIQDAKGGKMLVPHEWMTNEPLPTKRPMNVTGRMCFAVYGSINSTEPARFIEYIYAHSVPQANKMAKKKWSETRFGVYVKREETLRV